MAAFVAAVTAAAIIVLSLGLTRVHPLLAVGLNLVAVGGLAPTVWGWRRRPVWRWFVLGSGVGVAVGWLALLAMAIAGGWWPELRAGCRSARPAGRLPSREPPAVRLRARGFGAGLGLRGLGRRARRRLGVPAAARAATRSSVGTGATERSGGRSKFGVDELGRGVVERRRGAAVRAGGEAEVRDVVRPARLPRQLHGPAAVLVAPGVPRRGVGVEAAGDQRGGDGLQQRQHRGSVGEHRVGGGRQLGGAGALQQHGVGESLDPGGVDAGRARDLLDGCARADPGLNLLGTSARLEPRHRLGLAWSRRVTAAARRGGGRRDAG